MTHIDTVSTPPAPTEAPARPSVAVVVPFHGTRAGAQETIGALRALNLRAGDDVVLVDNTTVGAAAGLDTDGIRVVAAPLQQSSYHARNVGLLATGCDWVLFIDADCRPEPELLDRFFAEPVPEDCGILAGAVHGIHRQDGLVAEYSRSRQVLDQEGHLRHHYLPFANTSNLLARRAAIESVGGFHEGIRSGGDVDFCWRVQQAGWALSAQPQAVVEHIHRESFRALMRQMLRYGSGHAWLNRRHPGSFPGHGAGPIVVRALAGAAALILLAKPRRALFRVVDAAHIAALEAGSAFSNGVAAGRPDVLARPPAEGRLRIAVLATRFPELSETFVVSEARALQARGHDVQVVARGRGSHPAPGATHGLVVDWIEDDTPMRKLRDVVSLVLRHPRRVLADRRLRSQFPESEPLLPLRALAPAARRLAAADHVHIHFADQFCADGIRLSRLAGIPYSVTAHAYDIYKQPTDLAEKLRGASVRHQRVRVHRGGPARDRGAEPARRTCTRS